MSTHNCDESFSLVRVVAPPPGLFRDLLNDENVTDDYLKTDVLLLFLLAVAYLVILSLAWVERKHAVDGSIAHPRMPFRVFSAMSSSREAK